MRSPEQQISTSVLIVGSGGSGLRAAIELAEQGVHALAVGKRPESDAHTSLAAGGVNADLATISVSPHGIDHIMWMMNPARPIA